MGSTVEKSDFSQKSDFLPFKFEKSDLLPFFWVARYRPHVGQTADILIVADVQINNFTDGIPSSRILSVMASEKL